MKQIRFDILLAISAPRVSKKCLPSSVTEPLDPEQGCPIVDAVAYVEHNQTDSAQDVETNEYDRTHRNVGALPPVSSICWGSFGSSRRRCRLDGAMWNSVDGGGESGEETGGDGKAEAEYGASHFTDDDDEV